MQHSHVNAINVVKCKVIPMCTEEKLQVLSIPGWSGKVNWLLQQSGRFYHGVAEDGRIQRCAINLTCRRLTERI